MPIIEDKEGYLIIKILVQPRASRKEIPGIQGDALKIRLTAPPVGEAANKQCITLLSKALGISKGRIEIIEGLKSRKKKLKISGIARRSLEKLFNPH
ncbi:MAG: DUF167 domain-containing protein [Thermodesulfobacteriota bacterium]